MLEIKFHLPVWWIASMYLFPQFIFVSSSTGKGKLNHLMLLHVHKELADGDICGGRQFRQFLPPCTVRKPYLYVTLAV